MISHYKEPVDIASSNFSEQSTVYGGSRNFITGINNIISQYHPKVIGIASTCLSETIGEDVVGHIRNYKESNDCKNGSLPIFIQTATPSYCGSHIDGFYNTILATVKSIAKESIRRNAINIIPGFVSPADIRYLKEILEVFDITYILFPDYSTTLDNEHLGEYQLIPAGGTSIADITRMADSCATIEFGTTFNKNAVRLSTLAQLQTAGEWLESECLVKNYQMPLPIGIDATDRFIDVLKKISNLPIPEALRIERGRLIDAYVDAHKYVFDKKALIYGESDLVESLSYWLREIGMTPCTLKNGDFEQLRAYAQEIKPDLLIGNSKGYYIARELNIPIVRIGFPVHDRFGATRIHHIGYRGTQELFDRVVNALIEFKQENSPVGYKYI
jgi:nitrogenase molybdenum-iron protein NifN